MAIRVILVVLVEEADGKLTNVEVIESFLRDCYLEELGVRVRATETIQTNQALTKGEGAPSFD